ncbi:MAG: quinolinate synthase NadA [Alphaproteobacteria bacterium]|nr:quinolinate synthase NadA [Alphaproteobacteria bacterium]
MVTPTLSPLTQTHKPDPFLIDSTLDVFAEIEALRKERNAVILAHYYQDSEIQDIADFVGDSLELSRKAASTDASTIVFCGVTFMGEVAKILNPHKTVLIPDLQAGCSLEESCQPQAFDFFRKKYPDHLVLTYINSSAEIKAMSDIIVTSSNAERIINQIPKDQPILFAPDKYLGAYLAKKTGRDMVLWQGTCIVHEQFSERSLIQLKTQHPAAHVIAHPECPEHLLRHASHIGSTSSLLSFTGRHPGSDFIVLTEAGIIHQMKKLSPGSRFYDVAGSEGSCTSCNHCPFMRLNTIEKLYLCLRDQTPALQVDMALLDQAKIPLVRMLEMS